MQSPSVRSEKDRPRRGLENPKNTIRLPGGGPSTDCAAIKCPMSIHKSIITSEIKRQKIVGCKEPLKALLLSFRNRIIAISLFIQN